MVHAGCPSFFGVGLEDGHVQAFLAATVWQNPAKWMIPPFCWSRCGHSARQSIWEFPKIRGPTVVDGRVLITRTPTSLKRNPNCGTSQMLSGPPSHLS